MPLLLGLVVLTACGGMEDGSNVSPQYVAPYYTQQVARARREHEGGGVPDSPARSGDEDALSFE